jgi:hypothetical protein
MKRNLFKAKPVKEARWIEGYLSKDNVLWSTDSKETPMQYIDPKTISQNTGKLYSDGSFMYENDIVSINNIIYVVAWNIRNHGFTFVNTKDYEKFLCNDTEFNDSIEAMFSLAVPAIDITHLGNKFDNPDLLTHNKPLHDRISASV